MSAFGIFALILTTAYIIYFAVIICQDIIKGRKTSDGASSGETFDVSSFVQEEAVDVKEINGGFAVGDNETMSETVSAPVDTPAEESPEEKYDPAETVEKLTENMADSESDVDFDVSVDDARFLQMLTNEDKGNGTSHLLKRRVSAAEKPEDSSAGNVPVRDHM